MYDPILYSTPESVYLADEVAEELGIERGELAVTPFANGESGFIIGNRDTLKRRTALAIGSGHNPRAFLEMADLVGGLKQQGAPLIHGILTAQECETQEHEAKSGEVLKAQNRHRMMYAMGAQRYGYVDIHSERPLDAHDGSIHVSHIYAEELALAAIEEIRAEFGDLLTLVSPDAGRAPWVKSYAKKSRNPLYILDKGRTGADQVEIETQLEMLRLAVRDRIVVICDDMIRTASTQVAASDVIAQAGPKRIFAIATHAELPQPADEAKDGEKAIDRSSIERVYTTNSHPRSQTITSPKFRVRSVAPVIAKHLATFYGGRDERAKGGIYG